MSETIPLRDNIPSRRYPIVNILLILVNFLVFLFVLPRLKEFAFVYGVIPARLWLINSTEDFIEASLPLLTSMFLHAGWLHILSNMLFLWIFGDNVEDRLGHLRYLIFYLFCGIGAGLTHILFNLHSEFPTVGASGAISGILAAYFLMFPNARIITLVPLFFFFTTVELPAFFFIGIWFLLQFLQGMATLAIPQIIGVAFWAHIGGFVSGLILANLFAPRKRRNYLGD